jgi:hypothetical protein
MFSAQTTQPSSKPKNLKDIDFNERASIEVIIDELLRSAKDPYAASLPLIASAGLGDEKRYEAICSQILSALDTLDKKPDDCPQWMRNNSFKAWMFGRLLLAADNMSDTKTVEQTKNRLSLFLEEKMTEEDNYAFFTWAQGYRAALNNTEYEKSKKRMMSDSLQLSEKYKANPTDHSALSDALWAWIMNLCASANANDKQGYELIKQEIKSLTGLESVSHALETGLLRTSDSNDYPAWALAKIRLAAATMLDKELYQNTDKALISSIESANKAGAKAEYILAVIESQLAVQVEKELQEKKNPTPTAGAGKGFY